MLCNLHKRFSDIGFTPQKFHWFFENRIPGILIQQGFCAKSRIILNYLCLLIYIYNFQKLKFSQVMGGYIILQNECSTGYMVCVLHPHSRKNFCPYTAKNSPFQPFQLGKSAIVLLSQKALKIALLVLPSQKFLPKKYSPLIRTDSENLNYFSIAT